MIKPIGYLNKAYSLTGRFSTPLQPELTTIHSPYEAPRYTGIPDGFWVGADANTDSESLHATAAMLGITPQDFKCPEQYGLWLNDGGWSLYAPESLAFSPLKIDFSSGALGLRLRQAGRRQPLARAIGVRPGIQQTIIDATAGLGRDGGVLACLGCNVVMFERSPVLTVLLQDGWRRSAPPEISSNVEIHHANSCDIIGNIDDKPDVIYLDPMYPHREKSALVKKEMRIIRDLVGDDVDAPELLQHALSTDAKRVVVKRPRNAPPLDGPTPTRNISGPNTRYDIYERHI